MLLLIDIKGWRHHAVNIQQVYNIMNTKLNKESIAWRVAINGNVITVNKNDENKYFTSKVDNKIVMSATDKRIKTLGRNHLVTKRLTEKQYLAMIAAVLGTLDNLKLDATVSLEGKVWRQGMVNVIENVFKPNKFAERNT